MKRQITTRSARQIDKGTTIARSCLEQEMNTTTLNNWMQFLASVGVILSLIFVGVQIQQSRDIAIADIYQQRTALLLQHFSFAVPAETEFRAGMKDRAGEQLNPDEKYALTNRYAARIAYWENNHFQYQIGLLPEEQWEASKNSIRGRANRQVFLDTWERERFQLRKSFVDEIDGILEEEASN